MIVENENNVIYDNQVYDNPDPEGTVLFEMLDTIKLEDLERIMETVEPKPK